MVEHSVKAFCLVIVSVATRLGWSHICRWIVSSQQLRTGAYIYIFIEQKLFAQLSTDLFAKFVIIRCLVTCTRPRHWFRFRYAVRPTVCIVSVHLISLVCEQEFLKTPQIFCITASWGKANLQFTRPAQFLLSSWSQVAGNCNHAVVDCMNVGQMYKEVTSV